MVELYAFVTSVSAVRKTADQCQKLLFWLDNQKIRYIKVDLTTIPERRAEMEEVSGKKTIPQLHLGKKVIADFETVENWVENEILVSELKQLGYQE